MWRWIGLRWFAKCVYSRHNRWILSIMFCFNATFKICVLTCDSLHHSYCVGFNFFTFCCISYKKNLFWSTIGKWTQPQNYKQPIVIKWQNIDAFSQAPCHEKENKENQKNKKNCSNLARLKEPHTHRKEILFSP